jgi:primosomal protein N' (replication factor Y)
LESFHNTERGKYRLLTMPSRVDSRAMPDVHVVDLRTESMRSQGALLFSRRLHGAVIDRLDRAEQVILFLNRRGYSTAVICPACGHVTECPRCSISLTWHRRAGRLKCHLCGHDEAPRPACPKCGAERLRHAGAGTERIESSVARLFPTARVARMDSDVMTRKGDYERVFSDFRAGRIDILVGTQMIAKGLHFPNVTLVGVVNADLALHLPDFRAAERVFQLLTQVSGRAGRGDVPGEVIVQSHTPYHPAIQFAKRHDFAGFYEHEIAFRRQFGYPPCRRATLIHIRSRSLERAVFVAQSLARRLAAVLPASVDIGGPAPAPIDRIDEFHRQQIFLRGAQSKQLAPVWPALRREHETDDVALVIDVDPLSLL